MVEKLFGFWFKEIFIIDKYYFDVKIYEVLDIEGDLVFIFYVDFYFCFGKWGGVWMISFKF